MINGLKNRRLITASNWKIMLNFLDTGSINIEEIDEWRPIAIRWEEIVTLCIAYEYWNAASQLIIYHNLAPKELSLKEQLSFITLGV